MSLNKIQNQKVEEKNLETKKKRKYAFLLDQLHINLH